MTIHNIELAFDMFDADTCERFEQAVEAVSQKAQALQNQKGLKASESIRAQCGAIFEFSGRALPGRCLAGRSICKTVCRRFRRWLPM